MYSELLEQVLCEHGVDSDIAIDCTIDFYQRLLDSVGVPNRELGLNFSEQLEQLRKYMEDIEDSSTALLKVADRKHITQLLMALRSSPQTYAVSCRYFASGCTSQEFIEYHTAARKSPIPVDGPKVFWHSQHHKAKCLIREIQVYLEGLEKMSEMVEPQRSEYLLDRFYHAILGVTYDLECAGKTVRDVINEYPERVAYLYSFLQFYRVPTLNIITHNIMLNYSKKQWEVVEHNNMVASMLKDFLKLPM